MSVIAIITARGGSKGLPRKNLALLGSKPLIAYSILAAQNARCVQECFISSEDSEILKVAKDYNCPSLKRPPELAGDCSRSEDVVEHALIEISKSSQLPEWGLLLQPTSPLRNEKHIQQAFEQTQKTACKSLISVCALEHHPFKALINDLGFLKPAFGVSALSSPRQGLPEAYRQNGAIYLFRIRDFLEQKTFFLPPVLSYEMSEDESIDIDSAEDLKRCEEYLKISH
jgi:CMP-N-acetylneuraminic acid synthetase